MIDSFVRKADLVRVIDGDTIIVDIDLGFGVTLRGQKIRFLDFYAPETRGKGKEAGIAAKIFLMELLGDKMLFLQCPDFDQGSFGRWLAKVETVERDGTRQSVNRAMINAGHGQRNKPR